MVRGLSNLACFMELPSAPGQGRCFSEVVGTGTGGSVAKIEEPATLKRETTAADAPGQPVAQRLNLCDATVQRAAPRLGQALLVLSVRGPCLGSSSSALRISSRVSLRICAAQMTATRRTVSRAYRRWPPTDLSEEISPRSS